MSDARDVNMAKIAAGVEDEQLLEQEASQDVSLDSTLSVEDRINAERLKQSELKTQMAINRLEEAKRKATSDAVKEKLQQEIDEAKQRKIDLEEARKTQLAEAAKTTATVKTASDIASVSTKVASDIKGNIDGVVGKAQETVGHVAGTLETISTPGSIFLPITILLIFFFLLLPVNGYTRAQWLWMSMTGSAQITPQDTTDQAVTGQGGGGDEPVRAYTFTRG